MPNAATLIPNAIQSYYSRAAIAEITEQRRIRQVLDNYNLYSANQDAFDNVLPYATDIGNGMYVDANGDTVYRWSVGATGDVLTGMPQESEQRHDYITLVEQRRTEFFLPPDNVRAFAAEFAPTARFDATVLLSKASRVTFKVTPELAENKSVSYVPITEIRAPGSIHIFMGSPSRTFSINGKLISRTKEEALENFKYLSLLRAWTKPDNKYAARAGSGGTMVSEGRTLDNNVPRILKLYGYGQQLKGIPTVMTSLNINFPSDTDYTPFGDGKNTGKMPIIMSVDIQLQELRSSEELSNFDIDKYRTGTLDGW